MAPGRAFLALAFRIALVGLPLRVSEPAFRVTHVTGLDLYRLPPFPLEPDKPDI